MRMMSSGFDGARRRGSIRRGGFAMLSAFVAASLGVAPAAAQSAGAPGLGQNFSASASKPVEIVSDSLEVDDKRKAATFKGKVVVIQGDLKLEAREIVVHYVSGGASAGGADKAVPASLTAAGGQGGAEITTIDATGKVLISTKNGQTVTAAQANFDVKKQIVVMEKDVVVSQGKTVFKGDRLVVNAVDGTYQVDGPSRVKAVIIPGELKEQFDQNKAQSEGGRTQPEAKPRKKTSEGGPRPSVQGGGAARPGSASTDWRPAGARP